MFKMFIYNKSQVALKIKCKLWKMRKLKTFTFILKFNGGEKELMFKKKFQNNWGEELEHNHHQPLKA